jgi:hypothetical protein
LQDFIRDQNIKLYCRALAESTDDEQRRVLLVLLQLLVTEQLHWRGTGSMTSRKSRP